MEPSEEENALESLLMAAAIGRFVADPYSKWEIHYVGVITKMSILALMPQSEQWWKRWRRLEAQRWIAVHYLRERSLRSQVYLSERCEA